MFNIFSLILLFLLIYIFLKSKKKTNTILFMNLYICYFIISISLNIGYFMKIGNFEITYDEFLLFILFILAIIYYFTHKMNVKIIAIFSVFFVVILIGPAMNVILNYDYTGISYDGSWDRYFYSGFNILEMQPLLPNKRTIMFIFRIFLFVFVTSIFLENVDTSWIIKIKKHITYVSIIILFLFFIEFIFKNVFKSSLINDMYNSIFGLGNSTKIGLGDAEHGLYQVICLYREQSHYAIYVSYLSIMNLFFWALSIGKKENLYISLLLILSVLLSLALTSMLYILLYGIFLFIIVLKKTSEKNKIKLILTMCFVAVILVTISLLFFKDRLYNSVHILFDFENVSSYPVLSEIIRLYSSYYNLNIFLEHPFFGIGLGTAQSFSSLSTILVSIGLIGTIMYIILYNKLMKINKMSKYYPFALFIIFVLTGIFSGGVEFLYSNNVQLVCLLYSFFIYKQKNTKSIIKK